MLMHQASHGVAAEIHECPWPGQQQFLALYFANAYSGPALPAIEVDRVKSGEVIQALEADIVAIMGISLTGIPEANYEFHSPGVCANSVTRHYG